jgi:hypothetical protein
MPESNVYLLGSDFGEARVIQQMAVLAGNAIASSLVQLAEAQAAREVMRTRAGCDACGVTEDQRKGVTLQYALVRDAIGSEITRLSMVPPTTTDTTAAVYGVVQQNGAPVAGGMVELLSGEKAVARAAPDAQGRFSITADATAALTLRYSGDKGASWTDPAPLVSPGQPASYRVLDLADLGASQASASAQAATPAASTTDTSAKTDTPATTDTPAKTDTPAATFDPAKLAGMKLVDALAALKSAKVSAGTVQLTSGRSAVPQVTEAKSQDDGSVALTVAATPGDRTEQTVLAARLASDPASAGLGLDDPASAAKWLASHDIANLDTARKFAAQPLAGLGEALGSKDPGAAQTVRNLLTRTLDRIIVPKR